MYSIMEAYGSEGNNLQNDVRLVKHFIIRSFHNMKKWIALLFIIVISASLFACSPDKNADEGNDSLAVDSLQADLLSAIILTDGASLLDVVSGDIGVADSTIISELPQVPPENNPQVLNEWLEIARQDEERRQALEEGMARNASELMDGEMEYQKYLNQVNIGAVAALSYIGTIVGRQFAIYCINKIINEVLTEFGIDMRSTEDRILEKLQILDDIYESVIKIENTVNEINKRLKDENYFTPMNERHTALQAMSYATGKKYAAVVKYLSGGYDEYLEKNTVFNVLVVEDNYQNGIITNDYLKHALTYSFNEEFYLTRAYLNGEDSLLGYMEYMLIYHGDGVRDIINDWAAQTIGGNSICIEVKSLLGTYGGGFSADGKSFPEIYDYYAYRTYAWEHEGYEFREALRATDSAILSEAYAMAHLYYTLLAGNNERNLVAITEREELWELAGKYNDIQAEEAVVRHDDYLICQIEGCEYVFAKNPIYFDYYSQFKNHLNGCEFEDDGDDIVPDKTAKALDALFYDTSIVYDYDALDDGLKDKYTFDHATIGNAASPFDAVDWETVSEFAETFEDYELYLPQSAYQALFNYYKAKDKTVTSLFQIFEKELGITFAEETNLVCDVVKEQNKVTSKAFSTRIYYYYNGFRLAQEELKKNSDYFDVTVCLKDNPSELKNKRFADKLNVKTTDCCPINGWGEAANRFGGLMILGVQNNKIYNQ